MRMEDEYGLARCGIPCFLCPDKEKCGGCYSPGCTGQVWCANRKCAENRSVSACYECDEVCREGVFERVKHKAFREFAKRYGKEKLRRYTLGCVLATNFIFLPYLALKLAL